MKLRPRKIARSLRRHTIGLESRKFRNLHDRFAGKLGLEIGGPSRVFQHRERLPVYPLARRIDGVNFAAETVWEGKIAQGMNYQYGRTKRGFQHISEGTKLRNIDDAAYDFVLSSHSLEHSANALRAVQEWKRVLKPGGVLLVIVPNKDVTFDHGRAITSFRHLVDDFEGNVDEDDLTHLDEILANHDLAMDPPAGTPEQFRARSLKNFENRCLHHHVFDAALIREVFRYSALEPLYEGAAEEHIIILGEKGER
jgi:SAM-dependent methyltransferase